MTLPEIARLSLEGRRNLAMRDREWTVGRGGIEAFRGGEKSISLSGHKGQVQGQDFFYMNVSHNQLTQSDSKENEGDR